MKKFVMLLCFFASAVCLISAGLYINRQDAGLSVEYAEKTVSKTREPQLLSEINMTAYVSLPPSFSDIEIVEDLDNIEVTEDNVDDVMYDYLFRTASRTDILDKDGKSAVVDYTVTQGNSVQAVKSNEIIGYDKDSSLYDDTVYKELKGKSAGDVIHLEDVTFDGYENATLDLTVEYLYDMPYPATDNYVKKHTTYANVYDMRQALMNDASGEAKEVARAHTISSLIETMMDQTTFIKLPESLIMKELEALQKETPETTYEEAKHSLYKIFFIAAVIDKYDVATLTDMEKRYEKLDESEKEGLDEYEVERKKYLLFEDDVVTCIYRTVVITNTET